MQGLQSTYAHCQSLRLCARHATAPLQQLLRCSSAAQFEALLSALLASEPLLLAALTDCFLLLLEEAGAAGEVGASQAAAATGQQPIVVHHPLPAAEGVAAAGGATELLVPLTVHPLLIRRGRCTAAAEPHGPATCGGGGGMGGGAEGELVAAVVLRYGSPSSIDPMQAQLHRCMAAISALPSMVTMLSYDAHQRVLYQNAASVRYMGLRLGLGADSEAAEAAAAAAAAQRRGPLQRGSAAGAIGLQPRDGQQLLVHTSDVTEDGEDEEEEEQEEGGARGGVAPKQLHRCASGDFPASGLLRELFALSAEMLPQVLAELSAGRTWRGIVQVPALLPRPMHEGAAVDRSSTQRLAAIPVVRCTWSQLHVDQEPSSRAARGTSTGSTPLGGAAPQLPLAQAHAACGVEGHAGTPFGSGVLALPLAAARDSASMDIDSHTGNLAAFPSDAIYASVAGPPFGSLPGSHHPDHPDAAPSGLWGQSARSAGQLATLTSEHTSGSPSTHVGLTALSKVFKSMGRKAGSVTGKLARVQSVGGAASPCQSTGAGGLEAILTTLDQGSPVTVFDITQQHQGVDGGGGGGGRGGGGGVGSRGGAAPAVAGASVAVSPSQVCLPGLQHEPGRRVVGTCGNLMDLPLLPGPGAAHPAGGASAEPHRPQSSTMLPPRRGSTLELRTASGPPELPPAEAMSAALPAAFRTSSVTCGIDARYLAAVRSASGRPTRAHNGHVGGHPAVRNALDVRQSALSLQPCTFDTTAADPLRTSTWGLLGSPRRVEAPRIEPPPATPRTRPASPSIPAASPPPTSTTNGTLRRCATISRMGVGPATSMYASPHAASSGGQPESLSSTQHSFMQGALPDGSTCASPSTHRRARDAPGSSGRPPHGSLRFLSIVASGANIAAQQLSSATASVAGGRPFSGQCVGLEGSFTLPRGGSSRGLRAGAPAAAATAAAAAGSTSPGPGPAAPALSPGNSGGSGARGLFGAVVGRARSPSGVHTVNGAGSGGGGGGGGGPGGGGAGRGEDASSHSGSLHTSGSRRALAVPPPTTPGPEAAVRERLPSRMRGASDRARVRRVEAECFDAVKGSGGADPLPAGVSIKGIQLAEDLPCSSAGQRAHSASFWGTGTGSRDAHVRSYDDPARDAPEPADESSPSPHGRPGPSVLDGTPGTGTDPRGADTAPPSRAPSAPYPQQPSRMGPRGVAPLDVTPLDACRLAEQPEGELDALDADAGGFGGSGSCGGSGAELHSRYHEVLVQLVPGLSCAGGTLMVKQTDVTARVLAERRIAEVLEAEHKLLESVFPRHVLELAAANAQLQQPGRGAASSDTLSQYRLAQLPLAQDCASVATYHPTVTILFADIVGFTSMCQEIPATRVMQFLNDLYSRLDTLLDVYGVYKVETIGDCYMVAGGLMTRDADGFTTVRASDSVDELHAAKAMAFAKAMLREASGVLLPTTGRPVQMRIGLHSGPVTSGIVGSKMPRFCLFGDTVNTASRMESTCPPGSIHASAATQACLPDEDWEPTGGVQVKGKGRMETYTWQLPDPYGTGGITPCSPRARGARSGAASPAGGAPARRRASVTTFTSGAKPGVNGFPAASGAAAPAGDAEPQRPGAGEGWVSSTPVGVGAAGSDQAAGGAGGAGGSASGAQPGSDVVKGAQAAAPPPGSAPAEPGGVRAARGGEEPGQGKGNAAMRRVRAPPRRVCTTYDLNHLLPNTRAADLGPA